jgi:hypothetical protein
MRINADRFRPLGAEAAGLDRDPSRPASAVRRASEARRGLEVPLRLLPVRWRRRGAVGAQDRREGRARTRSGMRLGGAARAAATGRVEADPLGSAERPLPTDGPALPVVRARRARVGPEAPECRRAGTGASSRQPSGASHPAGTTGPCRPQEALGRPSQDAAPPPNSRVKLAALSAPPAPMGCELRGLLGRDTRSAAPRARGRGLLGSRTPKGADPPDASGASNPGCGESRPGPR